MRRLDRGMGVGPDSPAQSLRRGVDDIPIFPGVEGFDKWVMPNLGVGKNGGVGQHIAELISPSHGWGIPEVAFADANLIPRSSPGLVHPDVQITLLGNGLQIHSVCTPVPYGAGSIRIHQIGRASCRE